MMDDPLNCGLNPTFLLHNKLLVDHIHRTKLAENGLYFIIPTTKHLIHKVEIVGLVRKIYEGADRSFKVITVDDGSGCIQCLCSQWVLEDHTGEDNHSNGELGASLAALNSSLRQPALCVGLMVRVRGILSLAKGTNSIKQIKVQEFGAELDPNAFSDWVDEVSDVWQKIFSVSCSSGTSDGLPTQLFKEHTVQELMGLWQEVESFLIRRTVQDVSRLTDVLDQYHSSVPQHNTLCGKLLESAQLLQRFEAMLMAEGCVLKDGCGEVHISSVHSKLVKVVESAVRTERSLRSVIRKVKKSMGSGCVEETVTYVLDCLEKDSRIYSFLGEKQQKFYQLL